LGVCRPPLLVPGSESFGRTTVGDPASARGSPLEPPNIRSLPILQLPRRPKHRSENHRTQSDHEADDSPCYILAPKRGTQKHRNTDDPAGGDQTHEAPLHHIPTPLPSRQHALRTLRRRLRRGGDTRGRRRRSRSVRWIGHATSLPSNQVQRTPSPASIRRAWRLSLRSAPSGDSPVSVRAARGKQAGLVGGARRSSLSCGRLLRQPHGRRARTRRRQPVRCRVALPGMR
jgi:hypothetical protein